MTKTIAVMMYKGGSGKTTTVTNVAASLVELGKRTLLIDLDRQGNATTGVGFDLDNLGGGINDLFADPQLNPRSVILRTDFGLDVMAANRGLAKTGMNMSPGDMFRVREIIDQLKDDYDFVLIDTPPSEGYMTYNALAAADEVIIPVATRGFSEEGLAQTVVGIDDARRAYNKGLRLGQIIFTNVEKGTIVSSSVLEGVQQDYPDADLSFVVPKAASLDKGNAGGIPGVLFDPQHPASEVYRRLARKLAYGSVE
ncbi:MAG TPA: ParA family protein [Actinocrinis sp.]|nr:ParA family protein [Actinocrinis sp.]